VFSFLCSLLSARPAPGRQPVRRRPVVEGLEDRTVPSASGLGSHGLLVHHHHHHAVVHHHGHHHLNQAALNGILANLAAAQGPGIYVPPSSTAGASGPSVQPGPKIPPPTSPGAPGSPENASPNLNVTHSETFALAHGRPGTLNGTPPTATGGTGTFMPGTPRS
jgi:hypothetical protein